ncbi:hypothetical protein BD408DRAFT_416363 [Parasitella parasitica]|nr:hypothetical protein BD408DRAFT_416363 [Parasitella parasitica]
MSYSIIHHSAPLSVYQEDEKKTISLHSTSSPKRHTSPYQPELPPTPSSSAFSFLANDSKESIEHLDTTSNRLPNTTHPHYGALPASSDINCMQTSLTSTATTISPNDDDEGLYLLWTHQLLRERGYQPSSCKVDDDDGCSVDSSITELSTSVQRPLLRKSTNFSNWLLSWFPVC